VEKSSLPLFLHSVANRRSQWAPKAEKRSDFWKISLIARKH